jgi:hypothetical protein
MWTLILVLNFSPVTVPNFATAGACIQAVEHMPRRAIRVAYCVDTQTGDVIEAKP